MEVTELSEKSEQGEILLRHLKIAGELYMLIELTQDLVIQMKKKKPNDKRVNAYLRYYLLKNQGGEDISTFPFLREALEKILIKEMGKERSSFIDVYYRHKQKPLKYRFDSYQTSEWKLSSSEEMTEEDVVLMEKYKTQFLEIMKYAPLVKKHKKAKKEISKLIDSFSEMK